MCCIFPYLPNGCTSIPAQWLIVTTQASAHRQLERPPSDLIVLHFPYFPHVHTSAAHHYTGVCVPPAGAVP